MKHISISRFLLMMLIHFVAMFLLMYLMVDHFVNIYFNLNQIYMAAIMTVPMLILEILFMRSMYDNKRIVNIIMYLSLGLFILFFFFTRKQTAINNKQFIRSMIPHHASAILMCKNASITDSEIKQLCQSIISSQQSEINQMKQMLKRLD